LGDRSNFGSHHCFFRCDRLFATLGSNWLLGRQNRFRRSRSHPLCRFFTGWVTPWRRQRRSRHIKPLLQLAHICVALADCSIHAGPLLDDSQARNLRPVV